MKQIALERMQVLIDSVICNARTDPQLSWSHAMLAKKISSRHKIRMPYQLRIMFCKKCKSFMMPGLNSRIRLGRSSVKSVRISCNFCGHTYRKIIPT